MRLAMWLYRALARAFPHEFKMAYGAEVIQLGEDVVQEIAQENGFPGLFRLLADLAIRVPAEYLSEIRRDLRYALRALWKSRGFAAIGIVSLGLGIGLTAVCTSEWLNLFLRDAPGVRQAESLVMATGVSYPYVEHYRDHRDLFAGAAAFQLSVPYNVTIGDGKAERVFGHLVSPEYFSVIGVTPARGRVFSPEQDKTGSAPSVFISHRFWRTRMNSDSRAVGRTLRVNGQTATIVGIGPKDFLGVLPALPADIFVPTTAPPALAPELAGDVIHQREAKSFNAILRLAPGVTSTTAEAGLDTITRNLDLETLDPARNAKGRRVIVLPGGKLLPIPRQLLPMMFAFLLLLNGLIVTIVCMNLANMQLARATSRRKEVAIRLSVGASRFRLIRQLLTESVLLSFASGLTGVLLAFWVAAASRHLKLPVPYPIEMDITPDWRVMVIVFAIAVLTGIGFGLAPALAATKADTASALKSAAAEGMRRYRRFGMRNLLVVSQVAGSLSLLLITGFMVLGFNRMNHIDVAFDPSNMYLVSLDPVRDGYSATKAAGLFDGLAERLKRVPGVREVALAEVPPFSPQAASFTLTAVGGGAPDQVVSGVAEETIGPNYFAALSERVLDGREFDMRDQRMDRAKTQFLPVVINQTAAKAFFGARDPIGRRILDAAKTYEVAGVVKDLSAPLSQAGPGQALGTVPVIYLPLTKEDFARPPMSGMIVMVRSDHGADTLEAVRKELAAIDPNLAVFNVHTLAGQVGYTLAYLRISQFVYGGIGAFGMVLAAIGLAGVTAYSVVRRRKEIGIRMALGARKGQVMRLVLREGGSLVMTGAILGWLGAMAFSRLLAAFSSILGPSFQAGAHDSRLLIGAPVLLAALAMFACYVPARKSTRIDPLLALREE